MKNENLLDEIKETLDDKLPTVPFAMYDGLHASYHEEISKLNEVHREELRDVRHEGYAEKDKAVRGWKTACIAMAVALCMLIAGVGYFLMNFEIMTYEQDVATGGANFVGSGNYGDISYGETKNYHTSTEND